MRNILILILVLAVLGLGSYIYLSRPKPQPGIPGTTPQDSVEDTPQDSVEDTSSPSSNGTHVTENTRVVFYEGNGCSQAIVQTIKGDSWKGKAKDEDEARSVHLSYIPKGTVIKVYDSPEAKENDDFSIIRVTGMVIDHCVGTFEESRHTDVIQMTYYKKNGLDGKVSYISVDYP